MTLGPTPSTAVNLNVQLGQDALPAADGPQRAYLMVEVNPTEATRVLRMSVATVLVLDTSGSMSERQGKGGSGTKIECMREAAARLIDGLDATDAVGIVAFTTETHVAAALRAVGDAGGRAALRAAVQQLNAAGGTRIGPALDAAVTALAGAAGAQRSARIVLLTDGQTTREEECRAAAERSGQAGIPITVLGLGEQWNEELLRDVGERSGGYAKYIAHAEDILGHFQGAMRLAQSAVITDAALTLRTVDGVKVTDVWRIVPLIDRLPVTSSDGRTATVPLGAMSGQLGQTVVAALELSGHRPGDYRIAQVELLVDAPAMGLAGERHKTDIMLRVLPPGAPAGPSNPDVMNRLEQLRAWHAQTRALQEIEAGHVDNATRLLDQARTALLSVGDATQAAVLQGEIQELKQRGRLSDGGGKTIMLDANQTQELRDYLGGPPPPAPRSPATPPPATPPPATPPPHDGAAS